MNTRYDEILNYFPVHMKSILEKTFETVGDNLQEVRIRSGMPLIIGTAGGNFSVLSDGMPSPAVGGAYMVTERDLKLIFQAVCENSVYAFMDEIRQGFITLKGGHRVGFTGRAVTERGRIENFREISSMNIRIAHEIIGAANYITDYILKPDRVINTLIVSPPMGGKTTVLRDLTRQISNQGIKTALVDDRGELAALFRGVPQNDIGVQTDVIENAPKSDGIIMMLRTMSPQLVVTDEISTSSDRDALLQCFGTGVSVVASAHGSTAEEIIQREVLKPLLGGIGFEQIIVLRREGVGVNTRILGTQRSLK
ncbi:MAG: stage III sporulation protein AA [Ruminococcaceae bacterium]|nr:stage III sporulation protein AA [Oscillospiraceae bacterium]